MADKRQVSLPRTGWRHVPYEPGEIRRWDGKRFTDVVFKGVHGEMGILEPAWLPDPEGDPDRFRYWDGLNFTGHTFESIPNDGDFVYNHRTWFGVEATARARWEELHPPEPLSKRLPRFVRKYGIAILVILFVVTVTALGIIYPSSGGSEWDDCELPPRGTC